MNLRKGVFGVFGVLRRGQRDSVSADTQKSPASASLDSHAVREERRAHPRRYGDPVEIRIRSYDQRDPPCGSTGWVRDRSEGGLGVSTERPIEVGVWLRVRPTSVPDDVAWADVLVRHCRPQGARWFWGCQFVERPPRELLLLFR